MTRRRRSSRKPSCASSASARPRSASSERSWNSSNSTAATPSSDGIVEDHAREHALGDDLDPGARPRPGSAAARAGRPSRRPVSPSVAAMRSAAARAASRRGSSTMILPLAAKASSSSASGTRVVLPAPGGATSTARVPASQRGDEPRQDVVDRQRVGESAHGASIQREAAEASGVLPLREPGARRC